MSLFTKYNNRLVASSLEISAIFLPKLYLLQSPWICQSSCSTNSIFTTHSYKFVASSWTVLALSKLYLSPLRKILITTSLDMSVIMLLTSSSTRKPALSTKVTRSCLHNHAIIFHPISDPISQDVC